MNLKIKTAVTIAFVFIVSMGSCRAQSDIPFHEQIAFDFYCSEIIGDSQFKERLRVSTDFNSLFYISAECLKDKIYNEKKIEVYQKSKYFQGYLLDLKKLDKTQFKKVKHINKYSNSNNYVSVSNAYTFNNLIFVQIEELVENDEKTFTFEFDEKGNIIDWCLSSKAMHTSFE